MVGFDWKLSVGLPTASRPSQNLLGPLGPSQPVEFGFDEYINWLFSKGVTDDEQLQRCRDWGLVQR